MKGFDDKYIYGYQTFYCFFSRVCFKWDQNVLPTPSLIFFRCLVQIFRRPSRPLAHEIWRFRGDYRCRTLFNTQIKYRLGSKSTSIQTFPLYQAFFLIHSMHWSSHICQVSLRLLGHFRYRRTVSAQELLQYSFSAKLHEVTRSRMIGILVRIWD